MDIILFVLGLPGSGKSATARHIKSFAEQKKFQAHRFKDYGILYKMFQKDKEEKRFRSTQPQGYDGFDVLDFDVFDEALQRLHRSVQQQRKQAEDDTELLIIEFSRVDYCEALTFFKSLRLRDAHFLFINSEIQTCKARIKARAEHPRPFDNRYVSDYIFEEYYEEDHQQYLTEVAGQLNQRFDIPLDHIHVIHNGPDVTKEQFIHNVEEFAGDMLKIKV